jgi:rubrerythrin
MITLTPTKDLGATAKVHPVVYSEPEQTVTDELLAGMVAIDGMNPAFIADLLSAYLTHERCGTHLYRSVAGRTNNPVLKTKYEEFGEETMRHVDILEQLIASTGGNPTYVSPLARAVEAADSHALMSTYLGSGGLDPMAAEMAMLDVVFMAESVDHANWEALGQLAAAMPDGPAKEAMQAAVAEVEPDEDEHLEWARTTRASMTMLQASGSTMAKAGAKMEELVAHVKGWFGEGTSKEAMADPRPPASKSAPKKVAGKKLPGKKALAERAAAGQADTSKATGKPSKKKAATQGSAKTAAQRAVAKQAVAKAPAQRGAAKKATDSTTTAKTARTSSATKAPSKKAPSKKAASKKAASKSSAAKKAPAKKASGKKGPAKKASRTASRRG